jgi:hypothetical protein
MSKLTTSNLAELPPFASLTRATVARSENISIKALEALHRRGLGPPRYKVTTKRWSYPVVQYLAWKEQRLAEYAQATARQRKRHEAARRRKTESEVATLERMAAGEN